MEEYSFLVNGNRHRIRLFKQESGWAYLVEVDGERSQLELEEEFRCGLPFSLKIAGKSHQVEVKKIDRNAKVPITIDGKAYTVQHVTARTFLASTFKPPSPPLEGKRAKKAFSKEGTVTAPIPGRVALLKVAVGDSVRVGDTLCVLEAMKMENEIVSLVKGTVNEVRVSEGTTVNRGEVIIIIGEP